MNGRVGPYILERLLGRGATASVYLAARESDGQRVALKVFHPVLGGEASLRRAAQEFRAVSALEHPNIVRVFAAHAELDPPALAMEYVEGDSLEQVQSRLPYVLPELSLRIGTEILRALEAAHAKGLVHRDLKPANILVSRVGEVKVTDFGHSKFIEASQATATGTVLGSPDYMSPEQALGEGATAASDVFALGSVLYFLLTGTRPFSKPSPLATLASVVRDLPEPVHRRNPKANARISQLVARAMEKDPSNRFASAQAFREEIESYLRDVGLGAELLDFAEWVRHPHEVVMDSLRSVAARCTLTAEEKIVKGQWKDALECIQHLSIVAPESPAVPRLVARISREKARHRRWALWLPLAIGATAAVAIFVWAVKKPISATAVAAREAPPSVGAPVEASPAVIPTPKNAPMVAKRPPSAPSHSPRRYPVTFDLDPSVKVYWNGELVNTRRAFAVSRTGAHKVRFEKDGAPALEHTVTVKEDEPTHIRVR